MRIIFLSLLLFSSSKLFSQVITVIDSESKQPISSVLIYDDESGWSVATNELGKANITSAPANAFLLFQHPSYQEFAISIGNAEDGSIVPLIEKIVHIQEVVISANRWEQDIDKVPQEILSLRRKSIEQNQPQTSADLLASTGQVFVQKSQLGGGSPMLRGFAANNVLLVVDGVRMNNAIYRSGNLQNVINIDPLALEGTEVIFGPGSVIYGSDALGGVMDFHTITPHFGVNEKLFSGQGLVRYNTVNDEKTGHLHFTIGGPNISFFSSISYNDFDDLKAGENAMDKYPDYGKNPFIVVRENNNDMVLPNTSPYLQSPSGFNLFSTINKLRYRKDNLDLTYGFYFSNTSDIPRYDRHIELNDAGSPIYSEWYYGPQQWMMNSLKGEYFSDKAFFDQVRVTLANQQVQESRHSRKIDNDWRRNQLEEVDIWSLNVDVDKVLNERSSLFYGLEAVNNFISSEANELNIISKAIEPSETRYPSAGSSWNSYSGYLSFTHQLKEELNFSTGLRYSYITLNAENEDTGVFGREDINIGNGSLTGSLGLVYKPNDNWKFSSSFSNGFRAPNVDDVGKIFEVSDNTIVVPNEDLEPQYTYSAELSGSYRSDKWFLDLTLYNTFVDQAMTRTPFSVNGQNSITIDGSTKQIFALTNSGNAQIRGFTASAKHELTPYFGLETHFTYTWGEEDNTTPLRHVPPPFGKFSAFYRKNNLTSTFYINYNLTKNPDEIPLSERTSKPHLFAPDGSTPGWYTINLRASYRFNNVFQVRTAAENLLDLNYRTYSSGISAAGRSFMIALSYNF